MAVELAYQLLQGGDTQEALAELVRCAAEDDPASLLELGVWHLEGRHTPRNLQASRDCFRRAGELGNLTAENVFISFLANGIGGVADWQVAKERLRTLAANDPRAGKQVDLVDSMRLSPDGNPLDIPIGRTLSLSPQVWAFQSLFTLGECEYLIETAMPLFEPSMVVDPINGQFRPHPVRTSEGAMFPWVSEDLVISALNRRLAVASGTDVKCGEPLQVLRYRRGQEYRPHFDALPSGGNQRILTMLVYLNAGYRGGETLFTRTGLKFSGAAGDGLLFRNADQSGIPDQNSEHAGLPVLEGEKYLASRWIRQRPMVAS